MSIDFRSAGHSGDESHHYYRQATAPAGADPLQVGDLWSDTTANLLKRCTSVSPITFVSVEGGSAAHALFSATHGGDVNDADTPADNEVLTFDAGTGRWNAEPASGHGSHIVSGDDHAQSHALTGADHTVSGLTDGQVLKATGATTFAFEDDAVVINFIIDGGGAVISVGEKGHIEVPFAMTITGWTILADQSGSIVVDVWKDTYANFPPTNADSIAGTEKPTLSAAQKNQDLSLTSWTTSVAAGDILAFEVESASTVQRVVVALRGKKT
jgi:hypothetical protein